MSVPRERLAGWLDRFAAHHPDVECRATSSEITLTATDGTRAEIAVPFPPLPATAGLTDPLPGLIAHVERNRRIGVLLARRGGWAVGVFDGEALVGSKVGSSYVQGATKAGGWSQQRYARRRSNQAQQSADRAAEACVQLLVPEVAALDAVVTGGHRVAVDQVLADPRLTAVAALRSPDTLPTADPRLRVLTAFGAQMLAVSIVLTP